MASYEMSMLMPHLLMDTEWQQKWKKKGLDIPTKLSVWFPRMYNPVWINPDGFRWIELLKDEKKVELTFNLSPTWSETLQVREMINNLLHLNQSNVSNSVKRLFV